MSDPVLQASGLGKRFKGESQDALQPLDFELSRGTFQGLVGPDGAGKTTLLRLIAGLLTPTNGKVSVLGYDPLRQGNHIRMRVGYMPQKFGLYEDLTVIENLRLNADLRDITGDTRKKRFAKLLEFTDLGRFQKRRSGDLSGGMKQKLGLACALLSEPDLLLLDEPSVGVDPISRRELWQMVNELVGDGISVIWSTAYLDEAELCRDVLLLNRGELLFSGPPEELTSEVAGRSFLIGGIEGERRSLLRKFLNHDRVSDGVIQGDRIRIVLRKTEMQEADPVRTLGILPDNASVEPVAASFEDAFVDRLGGGPGGTSVIAEHTKPKEHQDGEVMVEAVHLTKKFGDFKATDDVCFQIQPGEIFGLLGPNGAGKSTTFKMMCGLLKPTEGDALVLGMNLNKSGGTIRQRIGYMAQKFSLYGNLTVRQNLDFFSGAYGLSGRQQDDRTDLMLDIFEMKSRVREQADSLPLGFKQRLALACSLMHEPDILFLDEPTSGVDPITRREFWTHIYGLTEKGVTVMVTTHFMDEAEYCDRVGLVFRGRLIAVDTPDALKQSAADSEHPDPTMEDAFIRLIEKQAEASATQ